MQVHYGFDVKCVVAYFINNGVGKTMEIKLAIVVQNFPPVFQRGCNSVLSRLVFIKKMFSQTWLPILIPKRGGFYLQRHVRMSDDAHGVCYGCPL
jgi:hypothetical protein